jgi:carbonic anhydrase
MVLFFFRKQMRKLILGIIEFHRERRDSVKDTFAKLALGQKPDALFIACSDSRVAVNIFASTDPGDLFVVRNAGNLVSPPAASSSDESEVAAIEFALDSLKVGHLIVCGHSDCGAMKALCRGRNELKLPHLKSWLRHGDEALRRVKEKGRVLSEPEEVNEVSRQNVLVQIGHLRSYPQVARLEKEGRLALHGLWFDIQNTDVYYADPRDGQFKIINDVNGPGILSGLKN